MRLALLGLLVLAPAADAAPLAGTPSDPAAVAVADALYAGPLAAARAAGSPADLQAWSVDLDGDGAAEIVGQIDAPFLCDEEGCVFVLRAVADAAPDLVFHLKGAGNVAVLDTSTSGWRDLGIERSFQLGGGQTLRFDGATYVVAR